MSIFVKTVCGVCGVEQRIQFNVVATLTGNGNNPIELVRTSHTCTSCQASLEYDATAKVAEIK